MRVPTLFVALLLSATFGFIDPACAQTQYVSFDVPGAVGDLAVRGLTDRGVVVGDYVDASGARHGFMRTAAGTLSAPIDNPDGIGTSTVFGGVNDAGEIVGSFTDAFTEHGFTYADGVFHTFDVYSGVSSALSGITVRPNAPRDDPPNKGELCLVGNVLYAGETVSTNFLVREDGSFEYFDAPDPRADFTLVTGVNKAVEVVGVFSTDGGTRFHSFMRQVDGTILPVAFPGAVDTLVRGISNCGVLSGSYTDADGHSHGFLGRRRSLQTYDFPGATDTMGYAINNASAVAGTYRDGSGLHGFVIFGFGPAGCTP